MELKLYNLCFSMFLNILLIVPYGIETHIHILFRNSWSTFNRTLWN